MHFEGNEEVLWRLLIKKQLMDDGNPLHREIRPALVIGSGTMRGVYGGGQVIALESFGLANAFETVIGVSTGAPTAAYFLAGQAVLGTTIYCDECTTREFMSLSRFGKGNIVDIDYLAHVFRMGPKALNQRAVRAAIPNFLVAATDAATGHGRLLNAKDTYPDAVEALRASIALPGFTHGNVSIGGRRYLDGAVALPLPARLLMRHQPTDVLFLANRSRASVDSRISKVASRLMTSGYSKRIQMLFMSRHARLAKELEYLRASSCRVAVVWSDEEVGAYERDKQKLSSAVERAYTHLHNLLMRAG